MTYAPEIDFYLTNTFFHKVLEETAGYIILENYGPSPSNFILFINGKFKASGSLEFVRSLIP